MTARTPAEVPEAFDAILNPRAPLVLVEDGFFIVRDEKLPGFRYDFSCPNAAQALRWGQHLADKTWITREHLAQFFFVAADHFKVPYA